jgi:hypothetical protein
MSAGPTQQQSRLLPYLLAILVVLLGYAVYTRVLTRGRPAPVVVTTPPPAAVTPAPRPEPTPAAAASPAPTASPGPGVATVPTLPSGRPNPFAALVTEQAARPAPPPPPPVPPPFFPGRPGTPGSEAGVGGVVGGKPRAVGVLLQDGSAVGIVEVGQKTYIVREGDVVEGFRVEQIAEGRIMLRRGDERVEAKLGGGEQP